MHSNRMLFGSAFLCQFILFRKQFFKAYIANFDAHEYPIQIDLASLGINDTIATQDLALFDQVMKLEVSSLHLEQIEKLDKLIYVLGFD